MNIYKARQLNAVKWANTINKVIESGGIVFDRTNRRVNRFVIRDDGDVYEEESKNFHYMFFINNPNLDNGANTKIADFDKNFDGWSFVYPPPRHQAIAEGLTLVKILIN